MRWFLKTKVLLVVLALLAIVLAAGVAWASGAGAPQSRAVFPTPQIVVDPMIVLEGTPALSIYGSGFQPNEVVFLKIARADGAAIYPNSLEGVRANDNRAFAVEIAALPESISAGVYTIEVVGGTKGSDVVTYPLVVVADK